MIEVTGHIVSGPSDILNAIITGPSSGIAGIVMYCPCILNNVTM